MIEPLPYIKDSTGRAVLDPSDEALIKVVAIASGLGSSSESAELIQTLQAWLAHHGQVDAAAQELGVHRHTVRHRLRRAEACLGRSLDEPSVRADLWFALSAQSEARDRFEP